MGFPAANYTVNLRKQTRHADGLTQRVQYLVPLSEYSYRSECLPLRHPVQEDPDHMGQCLIQRVCSAFSCPVCYFCHWYTII